MPARRTTGLSGLVEALKVSSDTYFFEVGELANAHGSVIQNKAHALGIGQPTGIDLPSEFQGVVPDSKWRAKENAAELSCERRTHRSSCGIVSEVRPWSVGDNMHLAVGQGDLLTDPLQMAVAYSTLANAYMKNGEGTVVTPHLGMEIDEQKGGLVQSLPSPAGRHVHLNYEDLSLVMEGIHQAASQPGGTSFDVWTGWDQAQHPVFGKTGTAEHAGQEDQSWYMCYIARPEPPDRDRGDRPAGRLRRRNRRADRPPDGLAVVRQAEAVRRRLLENVLMPLSPIKTTDETPVAPPRTLRLPFDPLLTLAVIGLGVCSLFTLHAATRNLVPGRPSYYVDRQAIYLVVGLVLMVALSRLDYARLRRAKNAVYATLILSILAVLALGHAARGSTRAINLPGFSFQASELGKVLLVFALVGARGGAFAPAARTRHDRAGDDRRAGPGDARDRPAGPGLRHGLHGRSPTRCCSSPAPPGGTSPALRRSWPCPECSCWWRPPQRACTC